MSIIKKQKIKFKHHCAMDVNVEFYTSAQDVVADCRARKITDSQFEDKSREHFGDWEGVKSYDEALELMRNGYQPTVEKLNETLKISKKGSNSAEKRIRFQNEICGFAPVVPLAIKGVPQSMVSTTIKMIKRKVIDVYYDMTVSCGTSTERIMKNGQKLLGAIMAMEKQGYRFNLYAVQTYTECNDADVLCVKVKSSDKPMDLKRMSFPLTHPAFFRVIGFDWYSRCPVAKYRFGYGCALAHTLRDGEDVAEFAKGAFGENAILLTFREVDNNDEKRLMEVFKNGYCKD